MKLRVVTPCSQARVISHTRAVRSGGASGKLPFLWLSISSLSPAQREAVLATDGPLLVLAGAGSGKTRVLTRRIAWLLTERAVAPWEILAITFTNKAAGEMRERVEKMLPVRSLWVITFHAMCVRMLRREIAVLEGYTRDFTIYDDDRQQMLMKTSCASSRSTTSWRSSGHGRRVDSAREESSVEEEEYAGKAKGFVDEKVVEGSSLYAVGRARSTTRSTSTTCC